MYSIVAFLFTFAHVVGIIQQHEPEIAASPWKKYGYIVLGGIILILVVIILIRKQHRKFNE